MEASASFFHDLGAFEVLLRNAIDLALRARYQAATGAPPWYRQAQLLPRAIATRDEAIDRATKGGRAENQDVVVAQLSFGFWRYLLTKPYQPTLWPTIQGAFPGRPRMTADRHAVEFRVERLYFLRNRIAHHEPIFDRNLAENHAMLDEVAGWICPDTRDWILRRSTVAAVLADKP